MTHVLLSLIYKVLTTSQPDYLHNLISVQSSGRTRSSSDVTLARPSVSSLLQITNRCFRYASPYLWNQLTSSCRPPRVSHFLLLPRPDFTNLFLHSLSGSFWTAFADLGLGPDKVGTGIDLFVLVSFFILFIFFLLVMCARLSRSQSAS